MSVLINYGAKVNLLLAGQEQVTALLLAVNNCFAEFDDRYLSSYYFDGYGNYSVKECTYKIAKLHFTKTIAILLKAGADPNVMANRTTALLLAAGGGNRDVVYILLKYGADANVLDAHQNTALKLGAIRWHRHVVNCLLLYTGACLSFETLPQEVKIFLPDFLRSTATIMIPYQIMKDRAETFYLTTVEELNFLAFGTPSELKAFLPIWSLEDVNLKFMELVKLFEKRTLMIYQNLEQFEKIKSLILKAHENLTAYLVSSHDKLSLFWQSCKTLAQKERSPYEQKIICSTENFLKCVETAKQFKL